MAHAVLQCPSGRAEIASATSRGAAASVDRGRQSLFTWLIAPAVRA
jgi:hypothetical protein